LDGFPQTKGQVVALEKCLTGFDFEAQEVKKEKRSKIAPPPEPVSFLEELNTKIISKTKMKLVFKGTQI